MTASGTTWGFRIFPKTGLAGELIHHPSNLHRLVSIWGQVKDVNKHLSQLTATCSDHGFWYTVRASSFVSLCLGRTWPQRAEVHGHLVVAGFWWESLYWVCQNWHRNGLIHQGVKHYGQYGNCLCSCDQLLHIFFATGSVGDCVIGGHYQFVMYSFSLQCSFVPASVG